MIARGLIAAGAVLLAGCGGESAPPGPPSAGEEAALADAEAMLADRAEPPAD